jgi:hypothetical protein
MAGVDFIASIGMRILLSSTKEVGGDLFNAFAIDDEHLLIAVGDISGKGMPAVPNNPTTSPSWPCAIMAGVRRTPARTRVQHHNPRGYPT